jgi:hypothetical protein
MNFMIIMVAAELSQRNKIIMEGNKIMKKKKKR